MPQQLFFTRALLRTAALAARLQSGTEGVSYLRPFSSAISVPRAVGEANAAGEETVDAVGEEGKPQERGVRRPSWA